MLIFHNSKEYNTDPKSEIRLMTQRLYEWFDTHLYSVVADWRKTTRRIKKAKSLSPKKGGAVGKGKSKGKGKGKGKGASNNIKRSRPPPSDSENDDDDDDDAPARPAGKRLPPKASAMSNARRQLLANAPDDEDEAQAGPSSGRTAFTSQQRLIPRRLSSRVPKPPARYRTDSCSDEEEHEAPHFSDQATSLATRSRRLPS